MATLIRTNGTTEAMRPKDGGTFKLDELQLAVGGFIEMLNVPDGRVVVLNEEGKLEGLAVNEEGTRLGRLAGIAEWDCVVGDVVVCTEEELE